MKKLKKLLRLWLFVCLLLVLSSGTAMAAEPKVMIADYKVSGDGKMHSGKEFDLSLTLQNTAKKNVRNMKVTVFSEAGEILPTNSAGTAYIEQIDAEQKEVLSFKLKLDGVAQEKSYKLIIKLAYEDGNGYSYNVEDSIFLTSALDLKCELTDIVTEGERMLGEPFSYSGKISNVGNGMLYNVKIKLSGDNIAEQNSALGNIEPGKYANFSIDTSFTHVSAGTQTKNAGLIMYCDREGNEFSEEFLIDDLFGAEIVAPDYRDLEIIKDEPQSTFGKKLVIIVVVVCVIAWIVIGIAKKRKRKKEVLEAFE